MNGSDAIALLKLDAPMTMKELGQRMGCDPSFVTSIADALEKHGLARREPSLRDRRSKNIVLTPEGEAVRERLYREILSQAPWCTALDTGERRCLLGLHAEDAPIARREVMLSQSRLLSRQSDERRTAGSSHRGRRPHGEEKTVTGNGNLGPFGPINLQHRSTARDRTICLVTAVVQHALKLGRIVLSATTPDTGQPTREVSTAAASSAAGTSAGAPPRRLGLALAVIATAQLMVVLDATIVNVALPHIQTALGFSGTQPGVGRQRVRAGVRRAAAARRPIRRPTGAPPDLHLRHPAVLAGLAARRVRHRPGLAARRAGRAGRRRRVRRAHRAVADRGHLPRGAAAQPGDGRVRGDERGRRRGRPDRRRPAGPVPQLALGVLRQRADRPGGRVARDRACCRESERRRGAFDLPGAITGSARPRRAGLRAVQRRDQPERRVALG